MASPPYGYRYGARNIVPMLVDSSTSDIKVGDLLSEATAGYVKQASAGDMPVGWATQQVDSPSADGDETIMVDISTQSIYELPPDTGSVSAALANRLMDVGGAQSVNIDADTDKSLYCTKVDTTAGTVYVALADVNTRIQGVTA